MIISGERAEKLRKNKKPGTTLIELMIATFIFGFLSLILLAVLNFGTRSWKSIESRSAVELELRRAAFDLNRELRGGSVIYASYGSATKSGAEGKQFYISVGSHQHWSDVPLDYSLGIDKTTITSKPIWRFILYYTRRPQNHDAKFGSCSADNPDSSRYYCPHKLLIKKELYANMNPGGGDLYYDNPGGSSSRKCALETSKIINHLSATESLNDVSAATENGKQDYVKDVRVLARNVLVFTTNMYDGYNGYGDSSLSPAELQYTLRCFKILEYGKVQGTNDLYSLPPTMSVQLDSKVIPMLDEGGSGFQ